MCIRDREKSYAMTMNSYVQVEEEKAPALLSRDYKDPTAVNSGYTCLLYTSRCV